MLDAEPTEGLRREIYLFLIVAGFAKLVNHFARGTAMSESNFVKLLRSEEAKFLLSYHPNAFVILTYIAMHARRYNGQPDGLIIGDALIGHESIHGLSRQNFRTAIEKLAEMGIIQIVSNGKRFFESDKTSLKREKSTIKVTIKCHLVNICDSAIFDINSDGGNQHSNQQLTNSQPTGNHKQERIKKEKERIKKSHHHPEPSSPTEISIPTNDDSGLIDDDFSFHNEDKNLGDIGNTQKAANPAKKDDQIIQHNNNYQTIPYSKNKQSCKETKLKQKTSVNLSVIVNGLETTINMPEEDYQACISIKGTHDDLTKHIRYILESPKRQCEISDWPNAIKNWKLPNKAIAIRQTNEDIAKQLVKDYEIDGSYGSTCQLYHCRDKDIKGIVFTTIGPAASTEEIIYYSNPEFQQKCDEQIANRRMKKRSA